MTDFTPEGRHIETAGNARYLADSPGMQEAIRTGVILEAPAIRFISGSRTLIVQLPCGIGEIPFDEGTDLPDARDIALISRVGKPVAFQVLEQTGEGRYRLSRRAAMHRCRLQYADRLRPGDIIPGTVTHIERFGCFIDIGCGVTALLPTDSLCYSHIRHPADLLHEGQHMFAVVRARDLCGRLVLSHKELLGTFEENAAQFAPFDSAVGVVRSVKSYGVFIGLAPNLTGLSEYREELAAGDAVSVTIKSIVPEKLKIKLAVISRIEPPPRPPLPYRLTHGHIDRFTYTPPGCEKTIETLFI